MRHIKEPVAAMHAFERQESTQTLAAGIAEYHQVGCGNSLNDEAVVKISSIFGTTGGFGVLRGYTLHESLEIYRALRVSAVGLSVLHSVFIVPRTVVRCLRQSKRWPWQDFERYMQVPLLEVRKEFGIRVAH